MAEKKANTCRPPIPSYFPWLLYFEGEHRKTQIFYDIQKDSCDIKKIPDMSNKIVCTNSHGWMVMLDSLERSNVCFLLNPITMEKIKLPPLKLKTWKSCILSLPPSDPTCIVGFFYLNRLMFCHSGEKIWREHKFNVKNNAITKVVYCQGKFYSINFQGDSIMEVGLLDNHKFEMRQFTVEKPTWDLLGHSRYEWHFIESLGEIFMVHMVYADLLFGDRLGEICVYKMDLKKLEWVRVDSLGDHRVFFLSYKTSIACSTSGSCIKKNSIYFTLNGDDYLKRDYLKTMYIYDMEEKTITTCLVCPDNVHNVTEGQWIMPNI